RLSLTMSEPRIHVVAGLAEPQTLVPPNQRWSAPPRLQSLSQPMTAHDRPPLPLCVAIQAPTKQPPPPGSRAIFAPPRRSCFKRLRCKHCTIPDMCPRLAAASAAAASIRAGVAPIVQCQATDGMRASYGGDVARLRIETNNGPILGNGLIAVPRCQPQAAGRIEIKLDAAKMSRQADA